MDKKIYSSIMIGLLIWLMIPASGAEWEDPPPFKERIFFGGNFGLTFGNTTSINVSPIAGYRLTPKLSCGLGLRYEYFKSNYPGYVPYDTHIFGASFFSRYMLIPNISETLGIRGFNSGLFLHGEYEMLSLESQYFDLANPYSSGRFNLHSILIGGGLYQPIGPRSGILITVLWNLNESYNSLYSNPEIRIGFNF